VVYGSVHAAAADAAFREAEACGIRCGLGKVMMDRHAPAALQEDTEASLGRSRELAEAWHGRDGGRLMYAFAPRFAPMCTPALMKGVAALAARFGALVQTHLAENLDELAWVAELFPEAGSYTDVYDRMGLLRPGTLLGHGIHLSPAERARIRQSGAAVVHCPRSNAFLKSGVMPLRRWMGEGLHVALGTDVGAGPSLSMRAEMETLCQASKLRWAAQHVQSAKLDALDLDAAAKAKVRAALDLEPQEPPADAPLAFFVATLGGARALGLGDRIGSLETGKDADFLVMDPAAGNPGPVPAEARQVLSRLVYRPETPALRATYVRGRKCWAAE
jgi:guanine deaminase